MGAPGHTTNERCKQLGRCILKTIRERRNDQRVDIEQIIDDPQIFEFFGDAARAAIDISMTHIARKHTPDSPKIETKLNDEKSVEYIESNSENSKRKKPDIGSCPNRDEEAYRDNKTRALEDGEEGVQAEP